MPEQVKLAVTNPPKALIALVAMVVITVLMITDSIGSVDEATALAFAQAIDPNAYVMDDGVVGTTTEVLL